MPLLPRPLNDPARLEALRRLGLLDSAADEAFDRLTELASQFLGVPVSVVALVDDHRQFFKAACGVTGWAAEQRQTPLSHSFCQHVVTSGAPLVIDDARQNLLVRENLAVGELGVEAYLGIPILSPDGYVVGSFCAIDNKPRAWTTQDIDLMNKLTQLVIDEISLRHENRQRVAAEAKLQKVGALQQAVLDGTQMGIVSVDDAGQITTFSRGAEKILDYTREECVGKLSLENFYLPSELAARAAELTAMTGAPVAPGLESILGRAGKGEGEEREWTWVRRDGTKLPVRIELSVLRDAAQAITGYVAVAQDLSLQRRTELALRTSEDRLQRVLGQAECIVWEARVSVTADDWDWRFTIHPSEMFHRLFREKHSSQAGLWYQFEIPEREEMNARSRQAMLGGANGYTQEFRVIREGRVIWIRESVSIVRTGAQHYWLVGLVTDISHVRAMTAQLKQSEEQFRSAFDFAGIGMALVGLDGRWLRVNRAICEIVGYSETELMRKTFQELTHPEDLDRDLKHVQELLDGVTRFYQMEKRYFHRDGSVVWIRLTASLVRDGAGAPVHFVAQIEDVTRQKKLEENLAKVRDEALAASQLKSEFLANMSHEIRTPMNGVIGMADLLMDTPLNEEQRQMSGVIRNSADSLLTIINDILDFSKIEAGKLTIEPVEFVLDELVYQTIALLGPKADARGLKLSANLGAGLPAGCEGDVGRIRQVLVNLVSNAVKFTQHGSVTVDVKPVPAADTRCARIRFEVRDTGIGISAAEKNRLFQPFSQADSSTTRKYGGSGLGLAISSQLVTLMHGTIGLESEPGVGSTFWFELELPVIQIDTQQDLATRPATPAHPATSVVPSAPRILVAEDNPQNQIVIRLLLEKIGCNHEVVNDGIEAIEKLATGEFAAVLMDCQMQRLDGYETSRRIRAGAAGPQQARIPIIALTAHAMASDREKCLAAGMDEYLSKPVRMDELQAALHRVKVRENPVARLASSTEPTAESPAPVDMEQLTQLSALPGRNGGTLCDELIGIVLQELPGEMDRLRDLIAAGEAADAAQLAHRLAGSAANFGAKQLRVHLRAIEERAQKSHWSEVEQVWPKFTREWTAVQDALIKFQSVPR